MLVEIDRFVNWLRRRNPEARTWRDYCYDLKQFAAAIGDRPPGSVTFHDVDRFVSQQAARGFKPATINRRLAAITAFYTFLADEDPNLVCPVLPHRHGLRQPQRLPRPVQAEDLRRFFAVIQDARDRAIFTLMLRCGLRISEVATLRLVDLYLDEPHPRLVVRGKGSKERSAYLSTQAEQALRAYLAARPLATSDFVFLSYLGDGLSTTAIHKRLMRYRAQAGYHRSPVAPHVCRPSPERRRASDHHPEAARARLAGDHPDLRRSQRPASAGRLLRRQPPTGGLAMSAMSSYAAERYDHALRCARHGRLPPGYSRPRPTSDWPAENIALLEGYREWLLSSGTSPDVINQLYIPMAGHALGLNLRPHPQLDLDADLTRALDYVKAKQLSAEWTDICRNGLEKFRRFLRQQRGEPDLFLRPVNRAHYCAGLPDWLVEQLERYQRLKQRGWRPARSNQQLLRFWGSYTRVWRWLFERHPITDLMDIKRQHILDFVDHRLVAGYATSTVNHDLRCFHAFLLYLQDQDYPVPQALLRMPSLKEPDRLPRFLTDEQVRRLRDDFEQRVAQANSPGRQRDALLDRAAFYLLWQAGLRLGEVEELRLEDLDLAGRRLTVRQGKGVKDRTVYLTDTVVRAVQDYLALRGMGPTDHVFLYRNQPVHKDLIYRRIRAGGGRVGVEVSPHRLRHTCATQLLNAGCRVTSIQKLLGHQRLNSTMIYARVHDRTVAKDYYAAMADIEKQLDLQPGATPPVTPGHLLALVDTLQAETLSDTQRETVQALRAGILALAEQATEDSIKERVRSDFQAQ
jgi:site-specific recombinase XerD